jgi:hypothetical protein
MCGRYALALTQDDVQQLDGYNLDIGEWVDEGAFFPRCVALILCGEVVADGEQSVVRGR